MAKLLIIDSNIENVKKIQTQFQTINERLSADDTFCYVSMSEIAGPVIMSVNDMAHNNIQIKTDFCGKEQTVLQQLDDFIINHSREDIMIIISAIMISGSDAMTIENYQLRYEYSCSLYHHLMKLKNGYNIDIPCSSVSFLMYSPSSCAVSAISHLLTDLYKAEEQEYFPKECCMPQNISCCRSLRLENNESDTDILVLPLSYREFIGDLN